MKKALLTAFVVMLSFFGTAQELLETYALDVGVWSDYLQDWIWEPRKKCKINFLFQGDIIIANDAAESTYYTYETLILTDEEASWSAIDERKRNCIVSMKYNGQINNYFIVMYSDVCYRYIWSNY